MNINQTSSSTTWGINPLSHQIFRIKNNEEVYYNIGKKLGKGSWGTVYDLVPKDKTKKTKAIKISYSTYLLLDKEYKILRTLSNSEGIQCPPKALFNDSKMVMPKYDGTLDQFILKMSVEDKKEAMCQLFNGLIAVHRDSKNHNDIKFDNVLIRTTKGKRHYHLADFGGVENYIENNRDIFSLATMFQEMIFFTKPNDKFAPIVSTVKIKEAGYPEELAQLINKMKAEESCVDQNIEKDIQLRDELLKILI